jgi:hypothetical protein
VTVTVAPPTAVPNDWVVCLGEARPVTDGRVRCPLIGGRGIGVEACSECRMLSWRAGDRDRADPCSTEPTNDR